MKKKTYTAIASAALLALVIARVTFGAPGVVAIAAAALIAAVLIHHFVRGDSGEWVVEWQYNGHHQSRHTSLDDAMAFAHVVAYDIALATNWGDGDSYDPPKHLPRKGRPAYFLVGRTPIRVSYQEVG